MTIVRSVRNTKMWLVDEAEYYDAQSAVEAIFDNGNGYRCRRQSIFRELSSGVEDTQLRLESMDSGDTLEINGQTVECYEC